MKAVESFPIDELGDLFRSSGDGNFFLTHIKPKFGKLAETRWIWQVLMR